MAIPVTNLRSGIVFSDEGEIYRVSSYNHKKVARGSAVIKVEARNLKTGKNRGFRFSSGNQVEEAEVEKRALEFIYTDQRREQLILADPQTKKRTAVGMALLGETERQFLKEGTEVNAVVTPGSEEPLSLEIPTTVELKVAQTGPSEKGNSTGSVTKPATLETGGVVQVPMFIKNGDLLKINTQSGEYVERART